MRRRTSTGSMPGAYMSLPSNSTSPVSLDPLISSCIRLKHRISVDFPEPDGPIRAVTARAFADMLRFLSTCREPNQAFSSLASTALTDAASVSAGSGTLPARLPNRVCPCALSPLVSLVKAQLPPSTHYGHDGRSPNGRALPTQMVGSALRGESGQGVNAR